MTETRLTRTDEGWLEPDGDGWYVLGARDAKWLHNELGAGVEVETSNAGAEYARFGPLVASTYPERLLTE
jgi:hypothetical protein